MDERMNPGPQPGRPLDIDAGRASEPSVAAPPADASPLDDPRALQILSTEHWSLLAGRSLAYNEAFSRAGMFLSFLSATLIVMGFLVAAKGFSEDVVPVVTILLLADLYIGIATVGRLVQASGEELQSIRGMNRIRHAYRDMVPGLEPYFVTSFHDDGMSVLAAYGDPTVAGILPNIVHGVTTTVGMVATINAIVLGALCAVVAFGFHLAFAVAIAAGVVGFLVGFALFLVIGMRTAIASQAGVKAIFPGPDRP